MDAGVNSGSMLGLGFVVLRHGCYENLLGGMLRVESISTLDISFMLVPNTQTRETMVFAPPYIIEEV